MSPPVPAIPAALADRAKRIDHIALAVRDLEASVTWYCGVLGFALVERRETRGARSGMSSAVLRCGPLTFVLMQGSSPESQVSAYIEHFGPGVQHVAIEVDDIESVVEALRAAGLVFDTPFIRSAGLTQIFSQRDPRSGLMLELIQRQGGDFSDESVEELFRSLEAQGHF